MPILRMRLDNSADLAKKFDAYRCWSRRRKASVTNSRMAISSPEKGHALVRFTAKIGQSALLSQSASPNSIIKIALGEKLIC